MVEARTVAANKDKWKSSEEVLFARKREEDQQQTVTNSNCNCSVIVLFLLVFVDIKGETLKTLLTLYACATVHNKTSESRRNRHI